MSVQLSNPLHTFARLREELIDFWEICMWKSSEDYRMTVKLRLEAHDKALREGYQSPYTDPDDYDMAWKPIVKRQQSFE